MTAGVANNGSEVAGRSWSESPTETDSNNAAVSSAASNRFKRENLRQSLPGRSPGVDKERDSHVRFSKQTDADNNIPRCLQEVRSFKKTFLDIN